MAVIKQITPTTRKKAEKEFRVPSPTDLVWDREQLAFALNKPRPTVDYLVQTNQVPFVRVGKRGVRFIPDQIKAWLIENSNREYRLGPRKPKDNGKGEEVSHG